MEGAVELENKWIVLSLLYVIFPFPSPSLSPVVVFLSDQSQVVASVSQVQRYHNHTPFCPEGGGGSLKGKECQRAKKLILKRETFFSLKYRLMVSVSAPLPICP